MRLSKRSTSKAVTENSLFGPRIQRLKASAAARRATTMKDTRPPPRLYTSEHAELFLGDLYQQARNDLSVFRRMIRPNMLWGWWLDEVARELQQFRADLTAGRRPKLALMAPPQHGKSEAVSDLIAWMAGTNPDLNIIYASYSDELGTRANRTLQRTASSEPFGKIFPLRIGTPGWAANNDLIEFAGDRGSFRNVTVGGGITGFGVDLGIIDDPFKGRGDANSNLIRDKIWSWFTDDFCTRLSKNAGFLIIMTRWHIDDLLGRLLRQSDREMRVLRYPALAEEDENHWLSDWQLTSEGWLPVWKHIRRSKGAALFPELKPKSFLLEQRELLPQSSWESLYQQNPIIVGGGQLPIGKLQVLHFFHSTNMISSVRYWDKGGSDGKDAAYTAGVLMHKMNDNTFVIEHVVRGRWSSLDREQRMREYAEADKKHCKNYMIVVEQEPGSAGKESAENTIRNLAGFRVYADRVTGSKQVRAEPFAAQVQAGNVFLRDGPWVEAFLDECETWPNGKYSDQVDAAAGAFNRLIKPYSYDTTYAGFNSW
jgi:predicted phage terminase large subunit-like protein